MCTVCMDELSSEFVDRGLFMKMDQDISMYSLFEFRSRMDAKVSGVHVPLPAHRYRGQAVDPTMIVTFNLFPCAPPSPVCHPLSSILAKPFLLPLDLAMKLIE